MAAAVTNDQPAASNVDDGEAALERDIRNLKDEVVDRAVSAAKGQGDSTVYVRGDGRTYALSGHIPNRDNDTKGMITDITRGAHLNPGDNWARAGLGA